MTLKKSNVLWLMIPVLFAAAGAQAGLTHLPNTGEEGSIYSGISSILGPVVEFAVFDTENAEYNGINGIELEEQGRFVYVYEIFNDYASEILHFNIYGIGDGAIDDPDADIGTLDDGDGVDAESYYFNSDQTKATWVFEEGTLVYGTDSVFLIIYSESNWTAGTYDFKVDDELPTPDVPEPATLMMLTLGGMLTFRRSRK